MSRALQAGDKVELNELVDVRGNTVSLAGISDRFLLIVFLRYAGCPFCNLTVHRLAVEHPLLKQSNCDILAFIQSDKDSIQKNIYDRHAVEPKYPIIADRNMKHYSRFGIKPSYKNTTKMIKDIPHWVHSVRDHGFKQSNIDGSLFLAPALFLVSAATEKIIHADYVADLFSHDTFSPIYDKILTE